ncbi:hypothethical protein [Ralstonia solanacearum PSI07]|nr:hypothethical protein [Ralstonia solanacearum PSI07]
MDRDGSNAPALEKRTPARGTRVPTPQAEPDPDNHLRKMATL